jgi:hypothetical protein
LQLSDVFALEIDYVHGASSVTAVAAGGAPAKGRKEKGERRKEKGERRQGRIERLERESQDQNAR